VLRRVLAAHAGVMHERRRTLKIAARGLSWQNALPRIIADFVVVHLSLITALAISVIYQTATGAGDQARALIADFEDYYVRFFWLLSPIFPLTFALQGFYTHTRSYNGRNKTRAILCGVAVAMAVFTVANLLVADNVVGRSVSIPFAVLAGFGLCFSRLLKNYLEKRFEVTPKDTAALIRRKPHVLVVGGAGYIGSLLVERFLQLGYRVRVLDALLYGKEPLKPVEGHPDFQLRQGDCRNMRDVVSAVQGVDAVVHLAAIVGDPACKQDQDAALEINYAATRMLIEVAKGHGVGRFLFASSCSVYGASDHEMDENSGVNPISLYAQTKVDSERALLAAKSDDFHPTILRFATVFGLGYRPRFDLVVNLLAARAKQDGTITIYNGQQWRPFIHARDVAEAIARALEAPVPLVSGEIFNVGDSRFNHTLQDVAAIIQQVFPHVAVEHVANSDRRNYRVNFEKIRNRLNFSAQYTVREGVEELKRAFEQGSIRDYTDLRYHNQRFLQAAGVVGHKQKVDALVMAAFATPCDGNGHVAGQSMPAADHALVKIAAPATARMSIGAA
jgi:nucleoside-diphosphate-sugar epimerase